MHIKNNKNSAKPQYFLKIIKEIEVMLFEKYNPCILYTKLKNNYFKEKYKKEDNTFYLPLNGKLSNILKWQFYFIDLISSSSFLISSSIFLPFSNESSNKNSMFGIL